MGAELVAQTGLVLRMMGQFLHQKFERAGDGVMAGSCIASSFVGQLSFLCDEGARLGIT